MKKVLILIATLTLLLCGCGGPDHQNKVANSVEWKLDDLSLTTPLAYTEGDYSNSSFDQSNALFLQNVLDDMNDENELGIEVLDKYIAFISIMRITPSDIADAYDGIDAYYDSWKEHYSETNRKMQSGTLTLSAPEMTDETKSYETQDTSTDPDISTMQISGIDAERFDRSQTTVYDTGDERVMMETDILVKKDDVVYQMNFSYQPTEKDTMEAIIDSIQFKK